MPEPVPAYTAETVRAAERPLLAAGVPLMARASAALARVADTLLDAPSRVLVVAGSGDNGGDALFAGAALAEAGNEVDVVGTGSRIHEAALAAALGVGARRIDAVEVRDASYDLVLDGILGIGTAADPALRGTARDVVSTLLESVRRGMTRVVAVDLPSGLHPDSGATADDVVLPAAVTATFGGVKAGLVRGRGPELAGRIVLVDIGLALDPADAVAEAEADVYRA